MSAREWVRRNIWHRWKRPQASCTASLERTFSKRYLSVHSNLANLNLDTAVMQQKRSRGWMLYSPRPRSLYILIRCNSPLVEYVLVYIRLGLSGRSGFVYITRRGQVFGSLSFLGGNAKAWNMGWAMERNFAPRLFLFPFIRDDSILEC